jgi:esterase/lipase
MREESSMDTAVGLTARARAVVRAFSGHRQSSSAPVETVAAEESQAALRQLSLERLMAYGVHHADAVELRGRVWAGEAWQSVATELAETCLAPPEAIVAEASSSTRANRLYRASALLRMSQMMMLSNCNERTEIFARAGALYEEAARLTGDSERAVIETANGLLTGWIFASRRASAVGLAVVIGGIEGWGMDFGALGKALARRGVDTLCLDGPGQGESRMVHRHYLGPTWERSYAGVFDFMARRRPHLPLAFVGNSMGGAVAMHLAARDPRIVACCDNGGPKAPGRPRGNTTFFQKMTAHVGDVSPEVAASVWRTIDPVAPDASLTCPLLVVHGGMDPLVSNEDAQFVYDWAQSQDKQMVVFSDGDHCVYNHADDKHNLIADWVAARLAARG